MYKFLIVRKQGAPQIKQAAPADQLPFNNLYFSYGHIQVHELILGIA